MNTEEKIKLYEELHPEGKEFPKTKKPETKPEDMEWLDQKLKEFRLLDATEIKTVEADSLKTYTVNQIKCLPIEEFKKIQQEVADGKARVVNH